MTEYANAARGNVGRAGRMLNRTLALAIALGPFAGLATGCNQSQDIPLAKVPDPPKLPAQDKTNVKAPTGSSPDVLPQ